MQKQRFPKKGLDSPILHLPRLRLFHVAWDDSFFFFPWLITPSVELCWKNPDLFIPEKPWALQVRSSSPHLYFVPVHVQQRDGEAEAARRSREGR